MEGMMPEFLSMPLSRMTIAARVFAASFLVLALTVGVLALADRQAERSLGAIDRIHQTAARRQRMIDNLVATIYLSHSDVSRHLALTGSGLEEAKMEEAQQNIASHLAEARTIVSALRGGTATTAVADLLEQIETTLRAYTTSVDEMGQMAQIDRMIAIPLMAHVDDKFALVSQAILAAQSEIGVATDAAIQGTRDQSSADRIRFLSATVVMLVLVLLAILLVVRSITAPLARLTRDMLELAEGKLDAVIQGTRAADEIGAMARALQVFQDHGRRVSCMTAEQERQNAVAEAEKRRAVHDLADQLDAQVEQIVAQVGAGAAQVRGNAASMLDCANEATGLAQAVSVASGQARASVQSAAAATGEMAISIKEISRRVRESFAMARQAVDAVEQTNAHVVGLSNAAGRIGHIVELINSIASQTNLLALNATIEAARAGEAGKGFAVVASEVKVLSNQIARATEEISVQIGGMQQATGAAVSAVKGVGGTVLAIDEVIGSIAAAMEEQSVATQKIARNVQDAAIGTRGVSETIAGVSRTAGHTGQSAGEVLRAAELLEGQAGFLSGEVKRFIERLRAS
jgi:methyl-accepting chemotaxis protein